MTSKSDLKNHIRARQAKTGESYTTARMHVLRAREDTSPDDPGPGKPLKAVVLKGGGSSLRLRIDGEDSGVTLRCSGYAAQRVAPAQCVEVTLTKRWTWRGDAYASGMIERAWTDIPGLGLEPLALHEHGLYDLNEMYEGFEPPDPYAEMWASLCATPRESFEFDGIAWGAGVGLDPDDDRGSLVCDAAETGPDKARELLMEAILADPRCIDAHVHLGNLVFDHNPKSAIIHYEIAIAIGELSLGQGFTGVLPWGYLYNRPFLRALHGYGLCLWRADQPRKARAVFERILSLNPNDNQGARYCWNEIGNGETWEAAQGK